MILTSSSLVTPTSPLGFHPICFPPVPLTPTVSPIIRPTVSSTLPPVLIVLQMPGSRSGRDRRAAEKEGNWTSRAKGRPLPP